MLTVYGLEQTLYEIMYTQPLSKAESGPQRKFQITYR